MPRGWKLKPILLLFLTCSFCLSLLSSCNDDDRKLAIGEVRYNDGSEYKYLAHDYGFLIYPDTDGTERFYVYDKTVPEIFHTKNLNLFIKRLKSIPNGVLIDRIVGCGFSSSCKQKEDGKLLALVLKEKKFRLASVEEDNFPVCTCESKGVVFYRKYKPLR